MMKYLKPEMEIIELEEVRTLYESGEAGGNEGGTDWGEDWENEGNSY